MGIKEEADLFVGVDAYRFLGRLVFAFRFGAHVESIDDTVT
jgi:hypothetical protein